MKDLVSRAYGLGVFGVRAWGAGFKGLGLRIAGLGFGVKGLACRA